MILVQTVCASQLGLHSTRTMFGLGFDFYIPQFSDTVVEKQDSPKVQNLRPAFPPPVAGTVETILR